MRQLRRTMMFVPGNNPGLLKDAHIYGADSLMFDLEDSVSLNEKDAARFLVYNALLNSDYEGCEIVVRVNGLDTPYGRDDFNAIVRAKPDVIRLPKTETAEDVKQADLLVGELEKIYSITTGSIKIMAAIESALGVINAYKIAIASPRLIAIAIGAEDFVTDMKTGRTDSGMELLAARTQVLLAARAAKIYALDTVFSDVRDDEGFEREVRFIKQLGFDGKSVIHPNQVEIVHRVFTPGKEDIQKSIRIITAAGEAQRKGSGVISLDGKMIDKPIIERAQRVLDLAEAAGLYKGGEKNETKCC
ncbi:MAG: citrate (pro-3S)-lyase subunit beta [Bacillota bacterium]